MHTDILVLFKSLVPAHTRRLKTGKVVRVRQYRNKVNKRPDEDDRTRDMFADDTVAEPRQDLIAEHKRLVDVLESPSHKDDKVEAKKQAEELREYEGESTNDDERLHQLIARAKALGAQGGAPGIAATLKGYIGGKNPAGVVISRSEGIAALEGMLATAEVKAKPAPKVVSVKAR